MNQFKLPQALLPHLRQNELIEVQWPDGIIERHQVAKIDGPSGSPLLLIQYHGKYAEIDLYNVPVRRIENPLSRGPRRGASNM